MTDDGARVHLVVGTEDLLVERAVTAVVTAARESAGAGSGMTGGAGDIVPVTRVRAGEVDQSELSELLSPSLFAEERVVVLESAGEAGKAPVELILAAAAEPPEGITLVIEHSGAGRAKSMVAALKKLKSVQVTELPTIKYDRELAGFTKNEFRAHGVRVSDDLVQLLVDAVGKDLRELAAAVAQLVADTGGRVDIAAVRRYYAGRAEVSGFEIAEKAVAGQTAEALEALRWAQHRGTPHVLLADALADAVHSVGRIRGLGRQPDQYRDAGELGMAPFKVKKYIPLARRWRSDRLARALQVVSVLNADVKGQAADPDFAVEQAVRAVSDLAG